MPAVAAIVQRDSMFYGARIRDATKTEVEYKAQSAGRERRCVWGGGGLSSDAGESCPGRPDCKWNLAGEGGAVGMPVRATMRQLESRAVTSGGQGQCAMDCRHLKLDGTDWEGEWVNGWLVCVCERERVWMGQDGLAPLTWVAVQVRRFSSGTARMAMWRVEWIAMRRRLLRRDRDKREVSEWVWVVELRRCSNEQREQREWKEAGPAGLGGRRPSEAVS